MEFYLDTANLEEIKKYIDLGIVDGVTTNPSLIAKEKGVDYSQRIKEITEIVSGPVSAEVISTDYEGMLEEAYKYDKIASNIYVKLPCTPNGIKALKTLKSKGLKVNMTLVFTAAQALICAKNGADLISPFIGRLDDISSNGLEMIEELTLIWAQYNFKSKILVASIRSPQHVVESAKMGAHVATIPPKLIDKLLKHPLTDIGLEKFLADYNKSKSQSA
jgi:transaldolase